MPEKWENTLAAGEAFLGPAVSCSSAIHLRPLMSGALGGDAHRAVVIAVLLEAGGFPGEVDLLAW